MKAILTDAIAVGKATARAILFASRDERTNFYPDRQWINGFVGGSYLLWDKGELILDGRTLFFYYATGIPRRWPRRSQAQVPRVPIPSAIRRGATSTVARPTRSRFRVPSPPRPFVHSRCTTIEPARA